MSTSVLDRSSVVPSPDDDSLYQVIDGIRVEKVMGAWQIYLANRLAFAMNQVAIPGQSGFAIVEGLFEFGGGRATQYRPDVAFISVDRWPADRIGPSGSAWAVVPDLAVEVVSPSNTADEIQSKAQDYLQAGVKLVWVIFTKRASVQIHDGSSTIRVVDRDGELNGGDVLPGFRLPLATLFEHEPG